MRKSLSYVVPLLLGVILLVSACSSAGKPGSDETASTLDRLQSQGYVRVGFNNDSPWAYATPDGELVGVAVDTARAIFARLGVPELDGVLMEWNSLIPGVQAGRFDVITASMAIQPARCEQVAFSNPNIKYGVALAVAAGNPRGLTSYQDIVANPDVKVGLMAGAIEIDFLLDAGVAENQIVVAADTPSLLSMLRTGQIDAITIASGSLIGSMALLDEAAAAAIELVEDFQPPIVGGKPLTHYGAAAFRLGDDELKEAWNEQLEKIKDSGELKEIHERYGMGKSAWPGDMTAAEQCSP